MRIAKIRANEFPYYIPIQCGNMEIVRSFVVFISLHQSLVLQTFNHLIFPDCKSFNMFRSFLNQLQIKRQIMQAGNLPSISPATNKCLK